MCNSQRKYSFHSTFFQYMKAVRCHRFAAFSNEGGKFELRKVIEPIRHVLSLDDVPKPEIQKNQVLIETHYAGIQYPDFLQAQGFYQVRPSLPYIPGLDLTGVVIDSSTDKFQKGDRVFATSTISGGTGALAQYCAVPQHKVWKVPDNVHLSECANLGRNFFAANHSLKIIGNVGFGSLVLVDGASGGVGMATIELAKAMGANVIAGVSSLDKTALPTSVGADRVLVYGRNEETYRTFKKEVLKASMDLGHPKGVDLVVDVVQGELFESLVSCTRPLGTICLVGFTSGQKPIRPGLLLVKEVSVVGSLWGRWANDNPNEHWNNVQDILKFLSDGSIQPRVNRIVPFENFMEAFEIFEENKGQGNTVVCIKEEIKSKL
jgi:NADPH:quinone reductase